MCVLIDQVEVLNIIWILLDKILDDKGDIETRFVQ